MHDGPLAKLWPLLCLAACQTTGGSSDPVTADGGGGRNVVDARVEAGVDAVPPLLDAAGEDPDAAPDAGAGDLGPDADLVCAAGLPQCADRYTPAVCNEDGTGFDLLEPCPSGAGCRGGECVSECLLAGKDPSYIGCTYWSVDLDNYPDPFGDPSAVPHAVVVSNPSAGEALVTVETMADIDLPGGNEFAVPAGEVRVYTFPRLDVDGSSISNHSFRLRASWPVVMYQFNPLNNEGVASNDASLLLPAETLGREYLVLSWPTAPIPEVFMLPPQHGYLTVVATSQGTTTVSVELSARTGAGPEIPSLEPGMAHEFELEQFDVLSLEADGSNIFDIQDLTGSIVTASQPVAVFGGHEEAVVGEGCCAEHLEQQMFPVETLGSRYLAARAETRDGPGDIWRIVAARDNTTVATVPPQNGGAGMFTLNRGEWREIDTADSFEVIADGAVQVGQYLRSQEDTGDHIGDPALILAVPVGQFRSDYAVLTPADYAENWLSVMRPAGVEVVLDGAAIPDGVFQAFGTDDYELAWVEVEEGPHTVQSEAPFGLSAYGYSGAVSYGYPAGLDLRTSE